MQTSVCQASIYIQKQREREREREEEKMGLVVMEEASRCWVDSLGHSWSACARRVAATTYLAMLRDHISNSSMMIMRLLRLELDQESFELLGLVKPLVFFCRHRGEFQLMHRQRLR